MTIKLIGAGLPRTGTKSLQVALEYLLRGKCHHMSSVLGNPRAISFWDGALEYGNDDWHGYFSEYVACVDSPSAYFWKELMEAYPDAKILLSLRDVDSWWNSMNNTVLQREAVSNKAGFTKNQKNGRDMMESWGKMIEKIATAKFPARDLSEQEMKRAFSLFNDEVKESIPTNKLIIWELGQGWLPLCMGLGVDIPDIPFPHLNKTSDFLRMA